MEVVVVETFSHRVLLHHLEILSALGPFKIPEQLKMDTFLLSKMSAYKEIKAIYILLQSLNC